jgi:hypothetical protein
MQKQSAEVLDNLNELLSTEEGQKAFAEVEPGIGCVDEGIARRLLCYTAGSFITLPKEEATKKIKQSEAEWFSNHVACGAAALAAKGSGYSPEEFANAWAKEITNATNKPFKYISELDRPDYHDASVVYLVGTERFSHVGTNWPKGFTITLSQGAPITDLEIVLSIAFGAHGLGEKLTAENPFRIIILGSKKMSTEDIRKLAFPLIKEELKNKTKIIEAMVTMVN